MISRIFARVSLVLCLVASFATAATLPYQGLATQPNGSPKVDGSYSATFKLYTVATGGTAVWAETQTSVATKRGLFSVTLGSVTAIPASVFDGSVLYLGVSLDGAAEASPRLQLGSVPFAIGAQHSDTARAASWADSAKGVTGIKDSMADLHQVVKDSADRQQARLVDSANAVRQKFHDDSLLHAKAIDSLPQKIHDTAQVLRGEIAALSTTATSQAGTIASQANTIASLQNLVLAVPTVPWNPLVSYGLLTDERDNQTYRTVTVGSQIWMAQNLNYAGPGNTIGACYGNSAANCSQFGRLYTWSEAMALNHPSSCAFGDSTTGLCKQSPALVKGLCPTGWHVPSDSDWTLLKNFVESEYGLGAGNGGTALKSASGWPGFNGAIGNGSDLFGFRALAGGAGYQGAFGDLGENGLWWSVTETNPSRAWRYGMNFKTIGMNRVYVNKLDGYALRCTQDAPAMVVVPKFSVAPGIYTNAQSVALNSAASGAAIFYTTDGGMPSTSSTPYSDPIPVNTNTTIAAIAVKDGVKSRVSRGEYGIRAAAPAFFVSSGTYDNEQTVRLHSATNGAVIHYTTDGSMPLISSSVYSTPLSVSSNMTISAIAVKAGMITSSVQVRDYAIRVATPTFSVPTGGYFEAKTVTINSATAGATIYYTTDGNAPTIFATPYAAPISVNADMRISAIAIKAGMIQSRTENVTYAIRSPSTWNTGISYGAVYSGSQAYMTVSIGEKTWMAENLNDAGTSGSVGKCYRNSVDSCAKFGRLYTWAEVMNGANSSTLSPSGVNGICPTGWHVPSDQEWSTMIYTLDNGSSVQDGVESNTAGGMLKSTDGWTVVSGADGNGTDDKGFRALPGGYIAGTSARYAAYCNWWSASEYDPSYTWFRGMYDGDEVHRRKFNNNYGFSLRCVRDYVLDNRASCVSFTQCKSQICSEGYCGYEIGKGPCTVGTGSTVCQSGACSMNNNTCMPQGGCAADGDCTSGRYCNRGSCQLIE